MAEKKTGRLKGMATLASIGIHLVAATFIGLLIGIYLDGYFGTEPWLTIFFLLIGIAAGFKNIFTSAARYAALDDDDGGPRGSDGDKP
jgi:ATP synthase protein I